MTITNVTCNGADDGIVCFQIKSIPTLPFVINIFQTSSGTPIANLNTPSTFPALATLTPVAGGLESDTVGNYCWNALPAGNYTYTITDSTVGTACVVTGEFEITEPDTISVDYEILPGNCGDADAALQASADGGTPPYSFELENVGLGYGPVVKTTGLFKNLETSDTDQYSLTVTDKNGCTANTTFLIDKSGALTIEIGTKDLCCYAGSNCASACDGEISVVVSGGSAPYRIILTSDPAGEVARSSDCEEGPNCQTAFTFKNLCAGDYRIRVIDANGCEQEYEDVITITEPTQITTGAITVTPVTCNDCCNGSIEVASISGGTPNYIVEITAGPEGAILPPASVPVDGTTPVLFENLSSGNYEITITDEDGCTRVLRAGIQPSKEIVIG